MKPHLPAVIALATLMGAGAALAAGTDPVAPAATDGTPVSPTHPPSAPPAPGSDQTGTTTDPAGQTVAATDAANSQARAADRAAFFDAHVAALHAGLALTPDQEKMWPALDKAIRGYAQMQTDLRDKAGQETSADDPLRVLRVTGERLLARGQALTALADASDPLYATLSEDQKRRLPMLLRDLVPRRGPVARVLTMLRGDRDQQAEEPRDDDRPGMRRPGPDDDRMGPRHRRMEEGMDGSGGRGSWDGPDGGWGHRGWYGRSGWQDGHARIGERDGDGYRPGDDDLGGQARQEDERDSSEE